MKQSKKLSYLLRLLWNSPIFGDSFPLQVYEPTTLRQIEEIYACFSNKIRPILAEGLPHSSILEINDIISQIAPKSIAFCAATSAGELEDTEKLCDAAMAIAITYWADQSMDRGDEAMLAAVRHIYEEIQSGRRRSLPVPSLQVNARLAGLRHIERLVKEINKNSEDLPYILRAIYNDSLGSQAQMRELSRQHLIAGGSQDFWKQHADETARTILNASGMMSAVTLVYAVYRDKQPGIPSLKEIYHESAMVNLIDGPFNGSIRVFDDLGDRQVDTGLDPQWGIFNLNVFNQSDAGFLSKFIAYSGVNNTTLQDALLAAFARADLAGRVDITKMYIALLREQFVNLPPSLLEKYAIFIKLCKRTLEAGLINVIGDTDLIENAGMRAVEPEILSLLMPEKPTERFSEIYQ